MTYVDIGQLQHIQAAISEVVGYLTDNSCSDENCCGGPYYTEYDYTTALETLERYGLKVED